MFIFGESKRGKEMKKLFITVFVFIIHYSLLINNCEAQWQPDVRLTNNPAYSYSSYNNARCVASSGNDVHVVWYDSRDGNYEIYYKRSTDGGISWEADTRLTNNTANSRYPFRISIQFSCACCMAG